MSEQVKRQQQAAGIAAMAFVGIVVGLVGFVLAMQDAEYPWPTVGLMLIGSGITLLIIAWTLLVLKQDVLGR